MDFPEEFADLETTPVRLLSMSVCTLIAKYVSKLFWLCCYTMRG